MLYNFLSSWLVKGQITSTTNCSNGCGVGVVQTTEITISGTDVKDFTVSKTMSRESCTNKNNCPQGNIYSEFEKWEIEFVKVTLITLKNALLLFFYRH